MDKSLVERLRGLFVLQNIDSQLDELDAEKGDLPRQVVKLENTVDEFSTRARELKESTMNWRVERDKADVDIISLQQKIEKLKEQQFEVRSNKQYDALTREITHAENQIEKLKKLMDELEGRMKVGQEDMKKLEESVAEVEAELKERRKELDEVSAITEDEELKFQHEREKIVVRIEKADIALYERIRKAKGGLAVVSVKRGSCGGCHNRIPPQRLLELRQHKTLYKCEHCGRILVSDEIVNMTAIPS